MFKDKFKYYKKKVPAPSLQNVLDVRSGNSELLIQFKLRKEDPSSSSDWRELGLNDPSLWQVFQLKGHQGLIFIVNPFTNHGQRYWIARSVADYSTKPSITNVLQQNDLSDILDNGSWWDVAKCEETCFKNSISRKMRWATMGYHHNWDTKMYSEDAKGPFPADLERLTKFIVRTILDEDFKPEAAIVNFYLMHSFLSGHVDRSELNYDAPLISLSFGQTAIFLLGGETINTDPDAMFLESGDVILMTGASRLQYHGVPKIIHSKNDCWNDFNSQKKETFGSESQEVVEECDEVTMRKVESYSYWIPFARYISQARINLNVRQVHFFNMNNK